MKCVHNLEVDCVHLFNLCSWQVSWTLSSTSSVQMYAVRCRSVYRVDDTSPPAVSGKADL